MHRLYNEDQYFINFFKFPENHPDRIRNTDIKKIGKLFDKVICQKVITSLVSRYHGPELAKNVIRNHIFGNLDLFHRFFYETLLDNQSFMEMLRVTNQLQFHVSDKDEELLISQANSLRDKFYDFVANSKQMSRSNIKPKTEKSIEDNNNN